MLKDRKLLTDGSSVARQWLHILLLILIPALTFSNTLGNDYHLDSIQRVKNDTEIDVISMVERQHPDRM